MLSVVERELIIGLNGHFQEAAYEFLIFLRIPRLNSQHCVIINGFYIFFI